MAYIIDTPVVGAQPIGTTETTQYHPIGTIVKAKDPLLGEGEFIYLKGVASTAVGDLVGYQALAGSGTTVNATTTRTVAATRGPVAVAMSANVANQFGWYQISGNAVINCAAAIAANALIYASATAGSVSTVTPAQKVDGAVCIVASAGAGTINAQINRPSLSGNG